MADAKNNNNNNNNKSRSRARTVTEGEVIGTKATNTKRGSFGGVSGVGVGGGGDPKTPNHSKDDSGTTTVSSAAVNHLTSFVENRDILNLLNSPSFSLGGPTINQNNQDSAATCVMCNTSSQCPIHSFYRYSLSTSAAIALATTTPTLDRKSVDLTVGSMGNTFFLTSPTPLPLPIPLTSTATNPTASTSSSSSAVASAARPASKSFSNLTMLLSSSSSKHQLQQQQTGSVSGDDVSSRRSRGHSMDSAAAGSTYTESTTGGDSSGESGESGKNKDDDNDDEEDISPRNKRIKLLIDKLSELQTRFINSAIAVTMDNNSSSSGSSKKASSSSAATPSSSSVSLSTVKLTKKYVSHIILMCYYLKECLENRPLSQQFLIEQTSYVDVILQIIHLFLKPLNTIEFAMDMVDVFKFLHLTISYYHPSVKLFVAGGLCEILIEAFATHALRPQSKTLVVQLLQVLQVITSENREEMQMKLTYLGMPQLLLNLMRMYSLQLLLPATSATSTVTPSCVSEKSQRKSVSTKQRSESESDMTVHRHTLHGSMGGVDGTEGDPTSGERMPTVAASYSHSSTLSSSASRQSTTTYFTHSSSSSTAQPTPVVHHPLWRKDDVSEKIVILACTCFGNIALDYNDRKRHGSEVICSSIIQLLLQHGYSPFENSLEEGGVERGYANLDLVEEAFAVWMEMITNISDRFDLDYKIVIELYLEVMRLHQPSPMIVSYLCYEIKNKILIYDHHYGYDNELLDLPTTSSGNAMPSSYARSYSKSAPTVSLSSLDHNGGLAAFENDNHHNNGNGHGTMDQAPAAMDFGTPSLCEGLVEVLAAYVYPIGYNHEADSSAGSTSCKEKGKETEKDKDKELIEQVERGETVGGLYYPEIVDQILQIVHYMVRLPRSQKALASLKKIELAKVLARIVDLSVSLSISLSSSVTSDGGRGQSMHGQAPLSPTRNGNPNNASSCTSATLLTVSVLPHHSLSILHFLFEQPLAMNVFLRSHGCRSLWRYYLSLVVDSSTSSSLSPSSSPNKSKPSESVVVMTPSRKSEKNEKRGEGEAEYQDYRCISHKPFFGECDDEDDGEVRVQEEEEDVEDEIVKAFERQEEDNDDDELINRYTATSATSGTGSSAISTPIVKPQPQPHQQQQPPQTPPRHQHHVTIVSPHTPVINEESIQRQQRLTSLMRVEEMIKLIQVIFLQLIGKKFECDEDYYAERLSKEFDLLLIFSALLTKTIFDNIVLKVIVEDILCITQSPVAIAMTTNATMSLSSASSGRGGGEAKGVYQQPQQQRPCLLRICIDALRSYRKTYPDIMKSICQLIPTLLQIERSMHLLTEKDIQMACASLMEILEEQETGQWRTSSTNRLRAASSTGFGLVPPPPPPPLPSAQSPAMKGVASTPTSHLSRKHSNSSIGVGMGMGMGELEKPPSRDIELIRVLKSALQILLPSCIDYHAKSNSLTNAGGREIVADQVNRDAMSRVIKNQFCEQLGIIDYLTHISPLQQESIQYRYEKSLQDQAIGQKVCEKLKRKKKLKALENLSPEDRKKKEKKLAKLEAKLNQEKERSMSMASVTSTTSAMTTTSTVVAASVGASSSAAGAVGASGSIHGINNKGKFKIINGMCIRVSGGSSGSTTGLTFSPSSSPSSSSSTASTPTAHHRSPQKHATKLGAIEEDDDDNSDADDSV